MLLPEIDRLLEVDEKSAQEMRRFFASFSHDLPELLNSAVTLYTTSRRAFVQSVSDYIRDPAASAIDEATSNQFLTKLLQGFLLCRIGVLYGIALAEFFRMRITTPLACIRIQCESLALIKLMHEDSTLAREWREMATNAQGVAFYQKYQRRVKAVLRSYRLEFAYDKASSLVLHSRFPGITFGYGSSSQPDVHQLQNFLHLSAQEFSPSKPDPFLMMVIHTLRVQELIFSNLSDAAPEIRDPLLLVTRIPQFREGVNGLLQQFARRRPDQVEQYLQQFSMDSSQPEAGHAMPAAGRKGKRRRPS